MQIFQLPVRLYLRLPVLNGRALNSISLYAKNSLTSSKFIQTANTASPPVTGIGTVHTGNWQQMRWTSSVGSCLFTRKTTKPQILELTYLEGKV